MEDNEIDHRATPGEACKEYAYNYGSLHPDRAWILTDFDTWEPNPHYRGPRLPHPEFDSDNSIAQEEAEYADAHAS